jgi:UDP-4-amino-4,6-dideoxy-N-acetyl-beta-L-altrosamine transaminase
LTGFLPYGRQVIEDDDVAAVVDTLRGDWLTTGPVVGQFEEEFARRTGAPYAISCSSGTAALHLAALAAGLGEGDGAVVPALTFLATANAIRLAGAEVVFADVDPDTALMRPRDLEEAIKRARWPVRMILPVHIAGQVCDMPSIKSIADAVGATIVEDACHAVGTSYRDSNRASHPVGACAHSDMAAFSFHPVKTIAMGEGGAVTTRDAQLAERLATLRNHGMTRDPGRFVNRELAFSAEGTPNTWYYEMHEPGLNYRASDIHCALGLSQLRKLDRFVEKRRKLASTYDRLLAPLAPLVRPFGRVPDCEPAWHLYAVLIDFSTLDLSRDRLMRELRERGIGTQVHYLPVSRQPYYRDRYGDLPLPGAQSYYDRCLSLPLYPSMSEDDVERVVTALSEILRTA